MPKKTLRTGLAWITLCLNIAFTSCASGKPAAPSLNSTPSRFANLSGVKIHYKSVGKGMSSKAMRALVFIHGWSGDMNVWREQVRAFPRDRMIFIDLPGHGRSDKPEVAYSQAFFALALAAVLDDAHVTRAILIGHSMGTPVAREFYRKFPSRTVAIVSVDGALRNSTSKSSAEAFIAPLRGTDYEHATSRALDGMMSEQTPTDIRDLVKSAARQTPQHVLVSAMEGMFDPEIWRDDPIVTPLLVINQSKAWGEEYKTYVQSIAPNVQYLPMSGVSHFLMLEKPEEFNALVRRFLSSRQLIRD